MWTLCRNWQGMPCCCCRDTGTQTRPHEGATTADRYDYCPNPRHRRLHLCIACAASPLTLSHTHTQHLCNILANPSPLAALEERLASTQDDKIPREGSNELLSITRSPEWPWNDYDDVVHDVVHVEVSGGGSPHHELENQPGPDENHNDIFGQSVGIQNDSSLRLDVSPLFPDLNLVDIPVCPTSEPCSLPDLLQCDRYVEAHHSISRTTRT
jgi:hypothetical protein